MWAGIGALRGLPLACPPASIAVHMEREPSTCRAGNTGKSNLSTAKFLIHLIGESKIMRLFIAEKPSLAAEIAKGLGSATKKTGYFEIGNDIVTWAYGHVLRQKNPEEYNEKYKVWKMEDLPIIPSAWELVVSENCRPQFAVIKKLILQ
ncbi:MAG: hypothetical protein ABFD79_03220, partial [Phycisphaerales bacterium]